MSDTVSTWLLTYLLHSSILLGLAWLFDRAGLLRRPRLAETVWRIGLCGGIVTASVQMGLRQLDLQHTTPALLTVLHTFVLPVQLHDITPVLAWVWLLPALFGLLQILGGVHRLNATRKAYPASRHPELSEFLHGLCAGIGRSAPTVRINDRWNSPLVLPNGDICVPEWVFERLDRAQREAMLAHEVAHLVRGDPGWRIAANLIARLGFLQPLNRLAVRRLELSAELCCDDWAARVSGHRRPLAEALYTCAQTLHARAAPVLTPAMASPSSQLLIRIGTLLEGGSMFIPKTLRGASILACAAMITFAAALTLPAVAINIDVASSRIAIDAQAGRFTSRLDGDIAFTEREDDVLHISKPMVISEVIGGKTWEVEFMPDRRTRTYSIGGTERPMDAQGRAWMAQVIPTFLRESGWDAGNRLQRLLRQGGPVRVLAEIEKIRSPHARAGYTRAYFNLAHPAPEQMARLFALTLNGAPSDHERAQVYVAALKTQRLDRRQFGALLADVESMHDSARICDVLLAAAAVMPADQDLVRQYRRIAKKTDDFRRGQAEKALDHLNM
jgi:beta-lactamase regulating signal transducer with metallopeptidase domain